ncbi:hydrolase [Oryctes borbonicus]|uniref:Carboxylic ester hydrolase n=1 Tax=Oryctes borbonicus TaxID=1629725 RepID=A0A0T6B7F3_9SCAR|nr:hydrolase [Oryctes borbonicus]
MRSVSFISLLIPFVFGNAEDLVINIPQGALRGSIDLDQNGEEYYKFLNIPYAQPPLGSLRFRAPVPAGGWEGIREVNNEIPSCFQPTLGDSGTEDCLYIHVYMPELPRNDTALKPVMVDIHSGIFIANKPSDGVQYLITKDVVLVNFNFRLGIFGSFSVDDSELGVPGNPGMKDQVLALKWVRDNIKYFGGDPDNVMIFGDSSGGVSVHLQVLSPMSEGLFHKALCESGVALLYSINGVRNNGILLARQLGVQTENLQEMLVSLQEMSPWSIMLAEQPLTQTYISISTPLVEMASNEPAFLPEDAITLIQSGNYNHVPFVIGYNNAEGLSRHIVVKTTTGENLTITDFTTFIPTDLGISNDSKEASRVAERIKRFYYGDTEPSPSDITQAVQLVTDYMFAYPSYRAAVEHLRTSQSRVYFYYFTADTVLNRNKHVEEVASKFPGASHTDQRGYLIKEDGFPVAEPGSVEEEARERIVTLWTDFAKYSAPWEAINNETFYYLQIDTNESTLRVGPPKAENMAFWQQLYDEYYPGKM